MKKVKIIVLTVVFCIASLGVSGTLHYCAGQIQAISIKANKHKGCGSCATGLPVDKSCCSEQTTLFQYDDFQFQKASFTIQYIPSFVVVIPYFIPLDNSADYSVATKGHYSNFSFFDSSTDAQSRLCLFTI
jgi:predicted nucleic acid-binding Zn ribbon protein